jgi:hypothetical protein
MYLLAVTAALALARRRLGATLRGARDVVAAGLFVAVGGTLAGAVVFAASSAYDYALQVSQLVFMDGLHGSCLTGDCLARQEQATFALQARAVGFGVLLLLAVNLVLVVWVTAARGGRLDMAARRAMAGRGPAGLVGRAGDVRAWLAAALVGSAVIHAAVVPAHLDWWPAAGAFFVGLAGAELALGALAVAWPHRAVPAGAVLLSVGSLALWAVSRIAGLPWGPEPGSVEPMRLPDLAACTLELATLYLALVLLVASRRLGRERTLGTTARAVGVLVLAVVTAFGLAGVGLATSAAGEDAVAGHHSHAG